MEPSYTARMNWYIQLSVAVHVPTDVLHVSCKRYYTFESSIDSQHPPLRASQQAARSVRCIGMSMYAHFERHGAFEHDGLATLGSLGESLRPRGGSAHHVLHHAVRRCREPCRDGSVRTYTEAARSERRLDPHVRIVYYAEPFAERFSPTCVSLPERRSVLRLERVSSAGSVIAATESGTGRRGKVLSARS